MASSSYVDDGATSSSGDDENDGGAYIYSYGSEEVVGETPPPTAMRRSSSTDLLEQRFKINFEELKWSGPTSSNADKLGQGAFGMVRKARLWGSVVAVKELGGLSDVAEFHREVAVLRALRHPNCVLLIGYTPDPNALIFEFLDMGSLHDLLHSRGRRIEPRHTDHVIESVANGLLYLHQQQPQILHRDVKPDNVLVGNSWQTVKLCDFGISSLQQEEQDKGASGGASSNFSTTLHYRAPEVSGKTEYTAAADVYSFGLLMYECIARKKPFARLKTLRDVRRAVQQLRERPEIPTGTPGWLGDLITRCWAHAPEARPSMEKVAAELSLGRAFANSSQLSRAHQFGTDAQNFFRGLSGQLYVSKSKYNCYARIYSAVMKRNSLDPALASMRQIVSALSEIDACQGSITLVNRRHNLFYGLILYADINGLRDSDALAAQHSELGMNIAAQCSSALYREVLECVPVLVKAEDQQWAHLTRLNMIQGDLVMESAMRSYIRQVVPKLAQITGFGGTLANAVYNDGRVYLFNLFANREALEAFMASDLVAESVEALAEYIDGPLSFDEFEVVSHRRGKQPLPISPEVGRLQQALSGNLPSGNT